MANIEPKSQSDIPLAYSPIPIERHLPSNIEVVNEQSHSPFRLSNHSVTKTIICDGPGLMSKGMSTFNSNKEQKRPYKLHMNQAPTTSQANSLSDTTFKLQFTKSVVQNGGTSSNYQQNKVRCLNCGHHVRLQSVEKHTRQHAK